MWSPAACLVAQRPYPGGDGSKDARGGNNCQYLIIRYTVVPGYEFNWGAVLFSLLNITDLHETMQALQGSLLRNRGI
jgi:hypothetical protein